MLTFQLELLKKKFRVLKENSGELDVPLSKLDAELIKYINLGEFDVDKD